MNAPGRHGTKLSIVRTIGGAATLALVAALAAAACTRSGRAPGADPADVAGAAATVRGLALVAAADSALDSERWDPDAVVASAGNDAGTLSRWVQYNTHWVPYRGILRGPAGVLNDRLGNSIDRALLLATLLEKAGYRVRLAHATLSVAPIRAALPLAAGDQVARSEGATPFTHDAQAVRDVADAAGDDADMVSKALGAATDSLSRAAAELARRTDDQAARLLRAVPRLDSLEQLATWFSVAPAALADHWWVQREEGGAWIDMDIMASGSDRLAPAETPVETLDMAALHDAAPYQEIVVRVVAEYRRGRALREKAILDYALRPAESLGQPIVLQLWPARWLGDSVARAELSRSPARNLPEEHEFGAMLVVGDRTVAAAGFSDVGETAAQKAAAEAGPMGGLAGAFSQSMGDTPERPSELTAMWIEYAFRVPGEDARTERRVVFDLIGPAARAKGAIPTAAPDSAQRRARAFALAMRTELLPVNCRLAPAFVNQVAAEALRGNARLFAAASGSTKPTPAALAQLSEASSSLPSPLLTLAVARLAWSPWAREIYIGRAGLLTRHVYAGNAGGSMRLLDAVDIVANDVEVGPLVRDPFAVRVGQGVFDTNAEALLMQGHGFGNVGDAYAQPTVWKHVVPADAAGVDKLPLPDDAKQRMRSDAVAGRVVLAPTAEMRLRDEPFAGWWRVDPASGTTLGMGENGWGLQVVEDASRTRQSITWSTYFKELARMAGPNFVKAFGQQMVICMAMTAGQDASSGRFATLGVKGEASNGVHECTGDAIVIAGLATVPLLAITMNEMAAIRAARLARIAATAGEVGSPLGKPNPSGQKPNFGDNGSPGQPKPEFARTEPDLSKTQPDLSKTKPDLSKTQPDLSKTQPDLSKTQPDLSKTQPDLSKTQPDLSKTQPQEPAGKPGETSPLAKTRPPGQSPYAETQTGLEKTEPAVKDNRPRTPQQEPAPNEPESPARDTPVDRSQLTPGRVQLLDMEQKLIELNKLSLDNLRASSDATGDFVRYRVNSPGHEPLMGDPSKYDPAVAQKLLDRANAMDMEWQRSYGAFKQQLDAVNEIRGSYRALRLGEQYVPTTPRQNFIGCPVNCSGLTNY